MINRSVPSCRRLKTDRFVESDIGLSFSSPERLPNIFLLLLPGLVFGYPLRTAVLNYGGFKTAVRKRCAREDGCPEGQSPFDLLGHFQRCEAIRKENALIGYAFCKKAWARSGRWAGDGAAVVPVSKFNGEKRTGGRVLRNAGRYNDRFLFFTVFSYHINV